MQTKFKKVPFDIELAKKITNKKVKGRVVTRCGRQVRIICFDKDGEHNDYPIIALIQIAPRDERIFTFSKKGVYNIGHTSNNDIMIEIPTYTDYSNFVPQKWQSCLVRNSSSDQWLVRVCKGKDFDGQPIFHSEYYSDGIGYWKHFIPLSNDTVCLIGTTKSYEELIEELNK